MALPVMAGQRCDRIPFPASVDFQLKESIILDRKIFRTEVFCIVFSTLALDGTAWAEQNIHSLV